MERNRIIAILLAVVVGLATLVATAPAQAGSTTITLRPPGTRYDGDAFPFSGYLSRVGTRPNKTVFLQKRVGNRWVTVARRTRESNGRYSFGVRRINISDALGQPVRQYYRTVIKRQGRLLGISPVRAAVVKPLLLPDLGVKKLDDCSPFERSKGQNGTCFRIERNAANRRLLKFPATTFNLGRGAIEVVSSRPSSTSTRWTTVQKMFTDTSALRYASVPATFYFAGDEHQHWHIRDFDDYQLLDASGTIVKRGEKHGFCIQENTTYRDWMSNRAAHPGMPAEPVYDFESSCGFENANARLIVHGLSVGWGDTYPTTLVDQAIDLGTLGDGTYVVRIIADRANVFRETNNRNNGAASRVTIAGDTVVSVTDLYGM